jgi:hypothetical protein
MFISIICMNDTELCMDETYDGSKMDMFMKTCLKV